MTGFYWELTFNCASIVLPLYERMALYPKATFELNENETESFKEIIHKLSDNTTLGHSQTSATDYQLITDISQYVPADR